MTLNLIDSLRARVLAAVRGCTASERVSLRLRRSQGAVGRAFGVGLGSPPTRGAPPRQALAGMISGTVFILFREASHTRELYS